MLFAYLFTGFGKFKGHMSDPQPCDSPYCMSKGNQLQKAKTSQWHGCEGIANTFNLPRHSRLAKENHGFVMNTQALTFQLNYTQVQDFQLIQEMLLP